ncbi:MAG TPA: 16S rRNA (adenine(1518)-N(6)/adenine(1519)-N(6))-dimethyltransferase RsmA [Candidatus Saccharimonadales bacterium]|nr:16S rRNA (adenine(1518)-N(6)/adenine(1519)-N(6))-dimethyltransferase RsmA [Candidatus Saccharimonadales bacterium]
MKPPPLSSNHNTELAVRLANIHPKKSLGQNFLIDEPSLDMVVAAATIKTSDTILEIGPGIGFLTSKICALAKAVTCVEADPDLVQILGQQPPANLTIVSGDIMVFNLQTLPTDYKVVANIPYYLTSKLLRLLLESPNPPAAMSILVQKEVAERIVASPGQMSILALSVQYYAYAKMVGVIERHKFWPAPKVDSAVLSLNRRPQQAFPAEPTRLFRLIKAGFGERRKQLKNALAGGLNADSSVILAVLRQAKVSPTQRAQELALADWHRLYQAATAHNLV